MLPEHKVITRSNLSLLFEGAQSCHEKGSRSPNLNRQTTTRIKNPRSLAISKPRLNPPAPPAFNANLQTTGLI
jgi:hypothetical protein